MISSSTGASRCIQKESNLGAASSSHTSDKPFDCLFPCYSQSMFSGLLEADLLEDELNGKFVLAASVV
jgi:hypothetical protein